MKPAVLTLVIGLVLGLARPAIGQDRPVLTLEREDGSTTAITVSLDRGFAAVRLATLLELGWRVSEEAGAIRVSVPGEIEIEMRPGTPFFRWDNIVLQMTDGPYRAGGQTWIPLQFVGDFLPRRLPGLYEFDGERGVLRAGDVSLVTGTLITATPEPARVAVDEEAAVVPPRGGAPTPESEERIGSPYEGVRVVVIDAGHGGVDPGALGPGGVREKHIALAIALRMESLLADVEGLEVHMIRDQDRFVDLWERGQIATELRGERPGIFVSIHANSFPARPEARGFETYFLSDARTEHERRVSAIENAPLSMGGQGVDTEDMPDIDFILRDLTNYDHAHWSADLAGLVQEGLNDFHPGPNRGVKQGVLAVLTNALMPAVLVEIGYLSNRAEADLLGRPDFQDAAAEALAAAAVRFFERYPPGSGVGGGSGSR